MINIPTYAVIAIEDRSDFPGVYAAWGLFNNWMNASAYADEIAAKNGVRRGMEVQVVLVEPANGETDIVPEYGAETMLS